MRCELTIVVSRIRICSLWRVYAKIIVYYDHYAVNGRTKAYRMLKLHIRCTLHTLRAIRQDNIALKSVM